MKQPQSTQDLDRTRAELLRAEAGETLARVRLGKMTLRAPFGGRLGLRLRPILMTTAAMVLGAVPLTLATGAGAEGRRAIGWVIVGGMGFGTLMTLFVVPAVYLLLSSRSRVPVQVENATATEALSLQYSGSSDWGLGLHALAGLSANKKKAAEVSGRAPSKAKLPLITHAHRSKHDLFHCAVERTQGG